MLYRDWSEDLRKVVADLRENGASEERIEEIVKKDLRRERRRLKRIKFKADQKYVNLTGIQAFLLIFSREPLLCKRVCPSVGQSVDRSVRPLVGP